MSTIRSTTTNMRFFAKPAKHYIAIALSLIMITVLSNYGQAQDFNALTSRIFFNIDLDKNDTTLISSLDSKRELMLKPRSGWTVYPPTDDKGNPIPFYTYIFFKHPYFLLSFADGTMTVLTDESKMMAGLMLSLSFNSKMAFDSTYKNLKTLYTKYSSKSIKRPGMGWPFEVTKFLSKDNNNYVIITKSEEDNKYYIHIAYNYQGYEW